MSTAETAQAAASATYRHWFECLKLSRVYREHCRSPETLTVKAKQVYEVFGRIRRNLEFDQWWQRRGRRVLAESGDYGSVILIDQPMQFTLDRNSFILQIPKKMSAKSVAKKVKEQLRVYYDENPVDPRQNTTTIPLHKSRVKMSTVEFSLKIWRLAHTEMADRYLYEIGEKAGVSPIHATERNDSHDEKKIKHALMSISVSRYIRQAELLMANAADGKFPCFDRNPKAQSRLRARRSALITDDI